MHGVATTQQFDQSLVMLEESMATDR